ncbi:MAG: 3',5'-cyclic-nucleotide phosphodiesterase [Acidobacteria bacterium]|nr:3',5'-cyclic-nucleotide phosphodiesterase [Acidobacteriota bacterium]
MKVKLLPGGGANNPQEQYLTSFLINDELAVDAGALPLALDRSSQLSIHHIFITHAHLDHMAGLPLMLDNIFTDINQTILVYAIEETVQALHKHIFNNIIWPDFTSFKNSHNVNLQLQIITPNSLVKIGGLEIIAVPVNHTVPTVGLIVKDKETAVVISGDTGITDELWAMAKNLKQLKAAFIECSYPNRLSDLAGKYGHLSPELLFAEYQKIGKNIQAFAYHLKPAYLEEIVEDLLALKHQQIVIAEPGNNYEID